MSDTIGGITVPEYTVGSPNNSNTFPLRTEYGFGKAIPRQTIEHVFGQANMKVTQRFYLGDGATRYTFRASTLTKQERAALMAFWESFDGPTKPFWYPVPQEDGSYVTTKVRFENAPLSLQEATASATSVGLTFVEVPDPSNAPQYSITSTCERFPNGTLATNLTSQTQEIIPLVTITLIDTGINPIYLSDRRVVVGGTTYLPRLLRIGEQGSEVLFSQSIDGSQDDMTLTFGNADRVMVQLANSTQLMWAKVELCLFRVDSKTVGTPTTGSGTLLKLWAGYVHDWHADAGPEFTLSSSDILTVLTRTTPVRDVSRQCWRRYGSSKGDGCPATIGSQPLDTTHFPSANASTCDLTYNGPNGCMAHQVKKEFGGIYCSPQGVYLRARGIEKSLTQFGFFPRTSIIADNIYSGLPLQEIWHNDDGQPQLGLPVSCLIAAGRDEDDFYNALGIVGRGPIGAYTAAQQWDSNGDAIKETFLGSTLDGQPHHGYAAVLNADGTYRNLSDPQAAVKRAYGLRQVLGNNLSDDYFSLGRNGTGAGWLTIPGTSLPMNEVTRGSSAYYEIFASDVAFMEIKRMKDKNDPISTPAQHTMLAYVSQGLTAYSWTSPGSRTTIPGCTNPFWVAVNTLLFSLGLNGASSAAQEAFFVTQSAIDCAAIADLSVTKLIGSGSETQFRFKGVINDRKPTRDWLRAIMTNALGYYIWQYGKIKFGTRINSSTIAAFNANNMLAQSLVLEPIKPQYEKLTATFNDEEYQFQQNSVSYTDQDHAGLYKRSQNPLAQALNISGCSTKSQAGRIITVRTREELGGVTEEEQRNAREATWKSTILALDTEAGMVVSVTDDDVPSTTGMDPNTMEFRISKWQLNRDWSVTIYGRTTTDSMYDLTAGPKPQDVKALPVQQEPFHDMAVPPKPDFAVTMSAVDTASAEINGLTFPDVPDYENTTTLRHGKFQLLYVDEADPGAVQLSADITDSATSVDVSSIVGISAGDYLLIEGEIVLCGTPSGSSIPITRAQYSTIAAAHLTGAMAYKVVFRTENVSFPYAFFATPEAANWKHDVPLPDKKLAVVIGTMNNDFGDSESDTVVLCTDGPDYGLKLAAGLFPGVTIRNVVNANYSCLAADQTQLILVTATDDMFGACTITLPNEEDMVGYSVTVKRVSGSTQNVVVAPYGDGDTIEGSTSSVILDQDGQSKTWMASEA